MTTRSTDVVYAGASLRERQDYAIALSKAGELIPRGLRDPNGAPNAGKILLVTEYGNALGIHPIVAINGIDIIEGNLTITPALMSGLIREAGHKLRVSTDGTGQAITATAVLVRADDPGHPFKVTWTMQDAKAAGLDGKSNWKKYPRAMLKARAISEVAREGAEDVLMGLAYTADEMGAVVNEDGTVIEAEVVEQDHDDHVVTTVRAEPAKKPPTASAASWARDITSTTTMDALTELRRMAIDAKALDLKTRDGDTVDQMFVRRRDELMQEQAGEPEPVLDVDEIDLDSVPF